MSDENQEVPEEVQDESTPINESEAKDADEKAEKEPVAKEPEPEENTAEETEPEKPKQDKTTKKTRRQRLWGWYKSHKKWSIPLTAVLLLVIVGVIPWSRYHAVGLVYKKDFVIQAID